MMKQSKAYDGPERRIHKVYVTRNTEYHVRAGLCVAVRPRKGEWVTDHHALSMKKHPSNVCYGYLFLDPLPRKQYPIISEFPVRTHRPRSDTTSSSMAARYRYHDSAARRRGTRPVDRDSPRPLAGASPG